jgi:hypothetical protein
MTDPWSSGTSLQDKSTRRTVGSRLADLGDRVARALAITDAVAREPLGPEHQPVDPPVAAAPEHQPPEDDGPDADTVDEYFRQRERELAELQSRALDPPDLEVEPVRIGHETSTILVAAHDQAREMIRRAQAQADHCLAEAASRAMTVTEQADQRVRALDGEAEALWSERMALLEDVQSLGAALSALADRSIARFPADPPVTHAAGMANQSHSTPPPVSFEPR